MFSPIVVHGVNLATRVVFAPINTGFAKNGIPDEPSFVRFHESRSGSAVGLCFVGNVAISQDAASNARNVVVGDAALAGLERTARAIRSKGSRPGIQLASSLEGLTPSRRWRALNSEDEVQRLRELVGTLSTERIDAVLQRFIDAARFSQECGFDVIEIHAAHGYFLSLLLSPLTNARTDNYRASGDWLDDFIGRLRGVLASSILCMRLSMRVGLREESRELVDSSNLCHRLVACGVQLLDLSDGMYTINRRLIYPVASADRFAQMATLSERIATETGVNTIFAAGLTSPDGLLRNLPRHVLVSLGRPMIADPNFAGKLLEGRLDAITQCARTGHCHYFTRGRPSLECGTNPTVGLGG